MQSKPIYTNHKSLWWSCLFKILHTTSKKWYHQWITRLLYWLVNRPRVASAVLQTDSWLTQSVSQSMILYSKYLHNTLNPKTEELGDWNFERLFIPHYVSCVTCHVSTVTCQYIYIYLYIYIYFLTFFYIEKIL